MIYTQGSTVAQAGNRATATSCLLIDLAGPTNSGTAMVVGSVINRVSLTRRPETRVFTTTVATIDLLFSLTP